MKALTAAVIVLGSLVLAACINGWVAMLLLGILWHEFGILRPLANMLLPTGGRK